MTQSIENRRSGFGSSVAFSLVELLVVIAIMAILASFAVPAVASVLRAYKLTTTGQALLDDLNSARQAAVSLNIPVEVRLYELPDYNQAASSTPTVYRATQCFTVQNGNASPLSRVRFFQSPVIVSAGASESPFLSSTNHPEQTPPTGVTVPGYSNSYRYRSFQFAPQGSTDLETSENSLTLVLQNDKPLAQGANFFSIQVNPITGGVRSFRP